MPRYDYDCAACGLRFEVVHGLHAPPPEACPHCGMGPIRKAFAPPTIHFKGSGWAKKERRSTSTGSGRAASDGDGAGVPSGEPAVTGATTKGSGETGSGATGSSGGAKGSSTSTSTSSSADGGSASD